ncbi:kunitz-type serine protease inhibitor homolog delta-dendrotoxin-like [Gigantopelta aegis]|uniref:kunitz-type serine protease inhibitor homolog delta-dendrotoxin-like n=1 Tax=Gigantopelta aegis TaxID=1735272 RepID=UPI001B88BFE7|nr:kunitz-type serine protease inhibitor homolog delta-dendrotoxin-like [Gigantopelta aegis]
MASYGFVLFVFVVCGLLESAVFQSPHDCNEPMDIGPCDGVVPRFFYSFQMRQCLSFDYGGCGGNSNNFKTRRECEDTCVWD